MLFTIAWRNIWRSRTRSLVVIGSIVIGIWALIFLIGFLRGQVDNYISGIIENETSHVQIHDSIFKNDFDVKLAMPDTRAMVAKIKETPGVKAVTARLLVNGMISSSTTAQGILVKGINPQSEQQVTRLYDKIIEGDALDTTKRNQILISQRMAEKLKVKIRSKVVVTFQNTSADITTAAFRVAGIYKTYSKPHDEMYVFAYDKDISRLAGLEPDAAHEIAIVLDDIEASDDIAASLQQTFQPWKVETYKEISPDLELFNSQIRLNLVIMTTIFMLALIFGIINTMLMAVLERMKELGMLMAVGMNRGKVFTMVVLETLFIALIGAPIGMLLGYMTIRHLHGSGIDLSRWSKALEEFGMNSLVRPSIDGEALMTIGVAVLLTAVLASIYPAFKAIRLKPVEALRKI